MKGSIPSSISVIIALVTSAGWWFNIPFLTAFGHSFIPMAPSTSLLFMIHGILSIFSIKYNNNKIFKYIILQVSVLIIIILIFIIMHSFLNGFPDIENLLYPAPPSFGNILAGRMSPLTAFLFIILYQSFILYFYKNLLLSEIVFIFSLIILSTGGIIIVGYWYGVPLLYGSRFIPVALPTAISFTFTGWALASVSAENSRIPAIISGNTVQTAILKNLLPVIVFFTFIERWLNDIILSDFYSSYPLLSTAIKAITVSIIICLISGIITRRIGIDIEAAETRFRMLFEWAPLGYQSLDIEGNIIDVNHAWLDMLGYKKDEVSGRWFGDFLQPDQRELFRCRLIEFVKEGIVKDVLFTFLRKDGENRTCLLNGRAAYNEEKNFIQTHCIIIDITEKKKIEDAMADMNIELERRVSERTSELKKANDELESFSYSVSHDLRAPLRHINGFMEMLRIELGELPEGKASHYMDVILRSSSKMGKLIDDLLAFSQVGRTDIRKEVFNLKKLIVDVIDEINDGKYQYSVLIKNEELPDICADRSLIKIVLINLLSNSIKFSSKTDVPSILISSKLSGNEIITTVSDNGAGFDMRYYDKLFKVFQRLHSDSDFAGTGIGLATARRIIEKHHGRIWAEGRPGEGSFFYFSLPTITSDYN